MMGNQTFSKINDFDIISKIGEGSFAEVYKVKRKEDGQYYAIKKIRMSKIKQKDKQHALTEIRILASQRGENIIGYKQAFYDENNQTLCIVMEYAQKGDLLKLIQSHAKKHTKIDESQIWKAIIDLSRGLKSLHEKKIIHRDIKSANIFITDKGVYKIGDLNIAKVVKGQMAKTQTGTPYYASPEVWKDQPYGTKSDMWSLGCVLYEMAAQRPPFTANDIQSLYKKVMTGNFPRIPNNYSDDLATVISSLLKLNPKDRPSACSLLNNQIVQSHLDPFQEERSQWEKDQLLETIKFNNKNYKMINDVLPKPNYQKYSRSKTQHKNGQNNDENKNTDNLQEKDIIYEKIRVNTSYLMPQNKIIADVSSNGKQSKKRRMSLALKPLPIYKNQQLTIQDLQSQIVADIIDNIVSSQKVSKKLPPIANCQKSSTQANSNILQNKNHLIDPKINSLASHKKVDNLVKDCSYIQEGIKGKQNLRRIGEHILGTGTSRKVQIH